MSEPDFRLHCRHCGGRFVEMKDLAFHHCPGRSDAQNPPRSDERGTGEPTLPASNQRRATRRTMA